jgi:hypothetical protein
VQPVPGVPEVPGHEGSPVQSPQPEPEHVPV